jgi:hypothetical protein
MADPPKERAAFRDDVRVTRADQVAPARTLTVK